MRLWRTDVAQIRDQLRGEMEDAVPEAASPDDEYASETRLKRPPLKFWTAIRGGSGASGLKC